MPIGAGDSLWRYCAAWDCNPGPGHQGKTPFDMIPMMRFEDDMTPMMRIEDMFRTGNRSRSGKETELHRLLRH